jgi:hypothetical protein
MGVPKMKLDFKSPDFLAFFAAKFGRWWFVLVKEKQAKSPKRDGAQGSESI